MSYTLDLNGRKTLLGAATFMAGRGGIARVARMTAQALRDLGAEIVPVSYLDAEPLTVAGFKVNCARASKLRFAALSGVKSIGCNSFIYDSTGIARVHSRLLSRGADYIVWIHGIEVWEELRSDHRAVIRAAKLVLVNSNYTLRRFESLHGSLPQARVCWLATEDDASPTHSKMRADYRPTVLALSRLDAGDAYKGQDKLIEAWPRVLAAVPEAKLVIGGDGNGRATLEALAVAGGVQNAVEFTGFVPEASIQNLWIQTDIFAMPSRKEGFGLVYAEAMRHGIPVIASTHDAGAEVNSDGESGFNINLDNEDALAEFHWQNGYGRNSWRIFWDKKRFLGKGHFFVRP